MTSRRGQLLVASPRLRDPNFFKTVVLIVKDEEEDGTLGVILNRPMTISVGDAIAEQVDAASGVEAPIHQGGPCEGPLVALHTNFSAAGDEVIEGVRFTMDREAIEWLLANNEGPIKYFAGYSGWGQGQLDAELEDGAWLVAPATQDHVFEKVGDWSKLTTWLAMGRRIDISRIPDDPSVN